MAIQATKQSVIEGLKLGSLEDALQAQDEGNFELLEKMFNSKDIQEGLSAFMEKRKPQWKNQ